MSPVPKRFAFLLAVVALLCAPSARALIIYGTGPDDVDNVLNSTDPDPLNPSAPWKYAVRFGALNASGVYLGQGYVLTAYHVDTVDTGFAIAGASYNRDTAFVPVHVAEGTDVTDLKLIRILGNPTLPAAPKLPLNHSTTADLNLACTLVGNGVGKGSVITNQGWTWGDGSTAIQRWGINKTTSVARTASYSAGGTAYSYRALRTYFDRTLGSDTAQVTFRDSGSGLFQQIDGVWKLSGVATTIESYQDGAATYDGLAPFHSSSPVRPELPDAADISDFVRLQKYAPLLRYENWAKAKLGSPTAALTADLENDGLSNLLEYAFHTDPHTAVTSLPQVAVEGGFITLTYTQLMSATDLSYSVEESSDLSGWRQAEAMEELVSTSGVTRVVKAKVAIGSATRKFLRLSVKKLP